MENKNENKNKFWKGVLVGALVTAFAGLIIVSMSAGIFLIGRTVMENQQSVIVQQEPVEADPNQIDYDSVVDKMKQIESRVDQMFLYDKDVETVEDGIYQGMMFGLGDMYAGYYNEEDYASLTEETTGIYTGIGAQVSQNRATGVSTIVRVFKGSPAEEAGLLPGDMIYKVNGEEVTGVDLDLLVQNEIRGEENTYVEMEVYRESAEDYVTLNIMRRQVEADTVEYQMLENQVGYILVTQFELVTGNQFIKAVDDLMAQGMEELIVDLRSNPGGVLDSVVEMAAYILPDGMLVYTADKAESGEKYISENGKILKVYYSAENERIAVEEFGEDTHQLDIPMVVLMNENSASASEVFAGALQDYGSAELVGTQSFGKGIVQVLMPLGDGTGIKFTTSHYYTPDGRDIHGEGLAPDVEVELDPELKNMVVIPMEEDNQLEAALEVLGKGEEAVAAE